MFHRLEWTQTQTTRHQDQREDLWFLVAFHTYRPEIVIKGFDNSTTIKTCRSSDFLRPHGMVPLPRWLLQLTFAGLSQQGARLLLAFLYISSLPADLRDDSNGLQRPSHTWRASERQGPINHGDTRSIIWKDNIHWTSRRHNQWWIAKVKLIYPIGFSNGS